MTCYVCQNEEGDLRRCGYCTASFCARCWLAHIFDRPTEDGLCTSLIEYATTYAELRQRREHEQRGHLLEDGALSVPDASFPPEVQDFAAALAAYQSSLHLRRTVQ